MGKLTFDGEKFYFSMSNANDEAAANKAGLRRDSGSPMCTTRDPHKALRLRGFADQSAELKLKNTFITTTAAPEHIRYPDYLSPKTWQIENAWHMLSRTPTYCADEAGMGKTISAVLAMNSMMGNTLITCPAYLKYNWETELSLWLEHKVALKIVSSAADIRVVRNTSIVLIIPDSIIAKAEIQAELRTIVKAEGPFKWLFSDESHRLKTGQAQRTNAFIDKIAPLAERVVLLSGTPMPNGRPIELFPLFSRLAPEAIGWREEEEYGQTFCAGKKTTRFEGRHAVTHWDFSGASNLRELQSSLYSRFMIRHEKKDHLHELGPKTRQLIYLDTPNKIFKLEKKILAKHELSELLGKNAKLGDIASLRKEIGLAKLPAAIEYITDLLESSDEKLIVSAHHIDVVEGLAEALKPFGSLKVRGGMTAAEKADAVEKFQNGSVSRVIVGNALTMGLGVTLTRAPMLVSVEADWTPGVNEQMEDRIHRIGQTKHCYVRYLVLRDSLDERMLRRALEKEENIRKLMNRKEKA